MMLCSSKLFVLLLFCIWFETCRSTNCFQRLSSCVKHLGQKGKIVIQRKTIILKQNQTLIGSPVLRSDGIQKAVLDLEQVQQRKQIKLFPVLHNELSLFLKLSTMLFLITSIFAVTRDTKDVLVITNCGAESISFLKVYGVIPAATLFMIAFNMISSTISPDLLFYYIVSPFILFYALFGLVLYPNRAILHQYSFDSFISLPYVHKLLKNWSFSLFYIITELWGSVGVPLLFWNCANRLYTMAQAKRIYPLFSLIGNFGPIFSGVVTNIVASIVKKSGASSEIAFENSLRYLTFFVTTCFGLLWALYSWIGVSSPPKIEDTSTTRNISKPGLLESLKVLRNNSLLYSLAIIVLSYGLTIEFSEIMWKSVVKEVFPDKTEYLAFMGNYSSLIGLSAFFMMLIGSGVINMLGWKAGALMTPLVMGVLGAPFFWFYSKAKIDISRKSLLIAAYVGLVQNVLSKAAKYAVFDPTKEMAYMQLDANAKVQGKAAIDVLGARAGKCLGAFVQQLVIVLTGSLASGTFVVSMLYYLVIANWIGAINLIKIK